MKSGVKPLLFLIAAAVGGPAHADETLLKQRITELERRVANLEQRLEKIDADDRWKDPILWRRIKKGMDQDQITRLLGEPARVEAQIFATWYYHPTSKRHSFVWFDEGKVLGWEAPPE